MKEKPLITEDSKTENLEEKERLKFIKEKAQEFAPEFIEIRKDIHENPELGSKEFETTKLIQEKLKEIGVDEIYTEEGRSGVIAVLKGTEEGKTIALRADIDALPIQEDLKHDICSKKEGVMHACGHDIHTAILLEVAKILKALKEEQKLNGDVVFIFQPNEEKAIDEHSGAIEMIKRLYKNKIWQKINAIFALHTQARFPINTVRVEPGLVLAGSSRIDLDVIGPGGHASRAHEIPSPLIIGAEIISEINKEFNPQKPQKNANRIIVNPTFIQSEGLPSYNVIPEKIKSMWTIRFLEDKNFKGVRQETLKKIKKIAEEVIKPWEKKGAEVNIKFILGTRPVVNRDKELVNRVAGVCQDVIGDEAKFIEEKNPGGEDFGFYEKFRGKQIPEVFFHIGAANPEKGILLCSHHRSDVEFDVDGVIPQGAAILAEMTRRELEFEK